MIIVVLVGGRPSSKGDDQIYAYAIGVLAGTVVQLAMALPVLRRLGFRFDRRSTGATRGPPGLPADAAGDGRPRAHQLRPGHRLDIGFTVSESAPRAIDAAFRIYMLPQGMFSVAVATVLFPALSRFVSRGDLDGVRSLLATGMRGVFLLLIPCAALTLVLAEPITRLVYQRGAFDAASTDEVSTALLWFSFWLPF